MFFDRLITVSSFSSPSISRMFSLTNIIDIFTYIIVRVYEIYICRLKVRVSSKCLVGKTAIVTGGNAGIGYATAITLASRGCRVIIADVTNGKDSIDQIKTDTLNNNIFYKYLDLSSFKSVRNFASDILKTEEKIDFLINNAGIGHTKRLTSEDGNNYLMQVNIFGAFLLTHLLQEPLKKARTPRVIFLTSVLSNLNRLDSKTLNITDYEITDENTVMLYANSKLCNILVTQELGKRLQKYGVTVNSFDPIGVWTNIFSSLVEFNSGIQICLLKSFLSLFHQDVFDVANHLVYVMTQSEPEKTNGKNYVLSNLARVPRALKDKKLCEELFSTMESLVQLKPEERIRKE